MKCVSPMCRKKARLGGRCLVHHEKEELGRTLNDMVRLGELSLVVGPDGVRRFDLPAARKDPT